MARFGSPASNNTVNRAIIRCSPCRTMSVSSYTGVGSYSFTVPAHCSRGPGFGWPGIAAIVIGGGGGGAGGVSCVCVTAGAGQNCVVPIGMTSAMCGSTGGLSCFRNTIAGGGGGGIPIADCYSTCFLCSSGLLWPFFGPRMYCGLASGLSPPGQAGVFCLHTTVTSTATTAGPYRAQDSAYMCWTTPGASSISISAIDANNNYFNHCSNVSGYYGFLCWCTTETTSTGGAICANAPAVTGNSLCVCFCGSSNPGTVSTYAYTNYGGVYSCQCGFTFPSVYCNSPGYPGLGGVGFGQAYCCCTSCAGTLIPVPSGSITSIFVSGTGVFGAKLKSTYGQGALTTGSTVSICVGGGGAGGCGWPAVSTCWSSTCIWGCGVTSAFGAVGWCHNKQSSGGNGAPGAVWVCWWT